MSKPLYLDHNATTPLDPRAERAMAKALSLYGNPSSPYKIGQEAKEDIEVARETIAKFVGAHSSQLIFTSGATEGNSIILHQLMAQLLTKKNKSPDDPPPHLITTVTEHASILSTCQMLESYGIEVSYIPVHANGQLQLDALENAIQPNTVLISIMWANNETGVIQPIEKVVSIANLYNVPVHCDAVQAFGKIPINFENSGLHSLSISAHKIGGPSGVGAMVLNDKVKIKPLILGGGQEKGRRSGTENFLGIIGFGFAVDEIIKELENPNYFYLKKERFEKNFLLKNKDAKIICYNIKRLHNTTAIFSPFMSSEAQVIKLDLLGFSVSAGSACSSGKINKSHVLRAMGLDWATNNTIRVSYGWQNDNNDLDNFTEVYKNIFQ